MEKITIIHEEEVQKGDVYYSVTFYDAEADQACDLVEGEKVYVVETQGKIGGFDFRLLILLELNIAGLVLTLYNL